MPIPLTAFCPRRALLGLTFALCTGLGAHAQTVPSTAPTAPVAPPAPLSPPAQGTVQGPGQVTVQPGDTAYAIARRAGITVEQLLALNGLQTPDLKVGQVLIVRAAPTTHTVQPGETLYALARRYRVTVDALLAVNRLLPDQKLAVGQLLTLPPGAVDTGPTPALSSTLALTSPPAVNSTPAVTNRPGLPGPAVVPAAPTLPAPPPVAGLPAGTSSQTAPVTPGPVPGGDWRATALSFLGTPYVLGGASRTGTDCSGLVVQVFTPLGVTLPRVSAAQAQVGVPVPPDALRPGDLVFFDVNQEGRVTHVGIYLGDDQFVNANSYRGQVTVDRLLGDRYWAPRYVGARRVLPDLIAGKL